LTHPLAVHVSGVVGDGGERGRADAEEPGPLLLPQAVALAADVENVAVVQEPIEDGGGDDGVAQDPIPFAEALVRGQDDAAPS
jgi:hypothetical protein